MIEIRQKRERREKKEREKKKKGRKKEKRNEGKIKARKKEQSVYRNPVCPANYLFLEGGQRIHTFPKGSST